MSEAPLIPVPLDRAAPPGWFGKMPHLGDFVSRRLPEEFIRPWDDWLQLGLEAARSELGVAWLGRYLVAPVRRFWIAPGLCGDGGWAGVLMPSVDAVGRHFPLTVALAVMQSDARLGLAGMLAARSWYGNIDAVARKVLDVNFSAEDFELELSLVEAPPGRSETPTEPGNEDLSLADSLLSPFFLAEGVLPERGVQPCSVWWTGEGSAASQFTCCAALPSLAELLNAADGSIDETENAS